jgi:ParB family transcriptional regulator, chromosome partitioning protein
VVELNEREVFEISIIENLERKNLNSFDEAQAFKAYVSDFGWVSISKLAERIGRSKRIRLLELPPDVLDSIINCKIDTSIAQKLSSIKDKSKQSDIARFVSERRLSLRKVRELLKRNDCLDHDPWEVSRKLKWWTLKHNDPLTRL